MHFLRTKKKINGKGGQVMLITAVLFLLVSLIIVFGLTDPIIKQARVASNLWNSKQSYYLSEAGLEDVSYRVKAYSDSAIQSAESLTLGNYNAVTNVSGSSNSSDGMIITTQSNQNNYEKEVQAKVKKSAGLSFAYGMQTGQGGFLMSNSSTINGNIYANGNIIQMDSGVAHINGTAVVANSASMFIDQINNLPTSPPNSVDFGKTAATQDIAQSFTVSSSSPITQLSLYIKKTGTPADIFIKIIKDSSGSPSKNSGDVLTSGTTTASFVTNNYNWVDVTFSPNPLLVPGTTYWIVADASLGGASNYYTIGANLDNSYANGSLKTGILSGSWNNTGYDTYFSLYLGGFFGTISGWNPYNTMNITGNVWAHNATYLKVTGNLNCQMGNQNNKACITGQSDPQPQPLPLSDDNINAWKADALSGGVINGDLNTGDYLPTTIGPKKINGNLIVGGSSWVIVTGTLWVTGNIIMDGNSKIYLSSSYGGNSGTIVVDGRVVIPGSCRMTGSGQTSSYILLISTSNCPSGSSCGGANAVDISGSGGAIAINAQKGTVNFSGSANAKEVTANQVILGGSTVINYETGLINPNFITGPFGSFSIDNWHELEQ